MWVPFFYYCTISFEFNSAVTHHRPLFIFEMSWSSQSISSGTEIIYVRKHMHLLNIVIFLACGAKLPNFWACRRHSSFGKCQNEIFSRPITCHGACQIERNGTVCTHWVTSLTSTKLKDEVLRYRSETPIPNTAITGAGTLMDPNRISANNLTQLNGITIYIPRRMLIRDHVVPCYFTHPSADMLSPYSTSICSQASAIDPQI